MLPSQPSLAVIGQGYVGLPLAAEFGKQLPTLGFDINQERIDELNRGIDSTLELSAGELAAAVHLTFSAQEDALQQANIYIVTVPTPIDSGNQPDLKPLQAASELIGRVISPGNVVVFESTVYPGCTEEVCIPIIERVSGLAFNGDFYAGYSPERINPGDKEHRVHNIVKVTSGSTPEAAEYIDAL